MNSGGKGHYCDNTYIANVYMGQLHHAFTLMELLIVISVIGILVGLLLPTLAQGKAKAKTVVCQSNLRQHGLAMKMYEQDYGAYVCEVETLGFINSREALSASWWQLLLNYSRSNINLLYCPSNSKEFRISNVSPWIESNESTNYQRGLSYGLNSAGTGSLDFYRPLGFGVGGLGFVRASMNLRDEDIVAPSDFIAIGDSQSDFNGDNIISAICAYANIKFATWPGSRHNRGANIVFVDGHVENQTQKKWVAKTSEARRRWNYDNQPHPETWRDKIAPP